MPTQQEFRYHSGKFHLLVEFDDIEQNEQINFRNP